MAYAPSLSFFWAASEQKQMSISWRGMPAGLQNKPLLTSSLPPEIHVGDMLACIRTITHICAHAPSLSLSFSLALAAALS